MAVLDYIYLDAAEGLPIYHGGCRVVLGVAPAQLSAQQLGLAPFEQEDYRDAIAQLLPAGAAWPRDPSSALMRVLESIAAEFQRVDARAAQLLAETDPATVAELLPDWERVVGLPDPCVTGAQTIAQRRVALEGRLTSVGGQSRAFFIALAFRLGYSVTIDEFASAGAATAGGVVFTGSEWAHIWRVNVAASVGVTPFRVGAGAAGEPLRAWGNDVIECQFNRFKPAHTRVLFAYET